MPLEKKSSQDVALERPRCHTAPPCCSTPSLEDIYDYYTEAHSPLYATYSGNSEPGICLQGRHTISQNLATASHSFPGRKPKTKKVSRPRRTADTVDIPSRIFIGGLTPEINEDDLRELFGPFGEILTVYIKNRGSENHRGFGFVTFKRRTDADRVVEEAINRRSFDTKNTELKVLPAFRHLKQYDTPALTPSEVCSPRDNLDLRKPAYGDLAAFPFSAGPAAPVLRHPPPQPMPLYQGAFIPLPTPALVPYFAYYDAQMLSPGFVSQFGGFHLAPNRYYNTGFGPPLNYPPYYRRPEEFSYAAPDHRAGDFQQPSCSSCPSCSEKRPTSVATSVNSDHTCCASCSGCQQAVRPVRPSRTDGSSNLRTKHGSTDCGASDPCRKSANHTPFDDSGLDVSPVSPRSY